MKSTGIVRKVDQLGRIVTPMELRRTLEIDYQDPMEIYMDKASIILRKYKPGCMFCGNNDKVVDFKGNPVCEECKSAATKLL